MTDDMTRYQSGAPGEDPGGTPSGADDEAALERLRALTPESAAPRPAVPSLDAIAAPQQIASRAMRSARARLAPMRRPAAGGGGRTVARLAVPIVFLVAVIAFAVVVLQSGVLGGDDATPTVNPTPSASSSAAAKSATKTYVVRSGDTLSGIAEKFSISVSDLEAINPKLSSTTLVVGTKIRVPRE